MAKSEGVSRVLLEFATTLNSKLLRQKSPCSSRSRKTPTDNLVVSHKTARIYHALDKVTKPR